MSTYYPDISHHHPVTDWNAVKSTCPFLISKATQGTNYTDTTLTAFIRGCEQYKIPYWLYTYMNKGGELAQAKFMVSKCASLVGDYFVGYVLDCEEDNTAANVQSALDWLATQCNKTMLYVGYSDYKTMYSGLALPSNCVLWESRYGRNAGTYNSAYPCHDAAGLHQYTSNGTVTGISGRCDLNRLTGLVDESWFLSADGTATDTGTLVCPYSEPSNVVKLKTRGTSVKWVQWMLNNCGIGYSLTVDGIAGNNTIGAVLDFQKRKNLTVDGIVGTATRTALKACLE